MSNSAPIMSKSARIMSNCAPIMSKSADVMYYKSIYKKQENARIVSESAVKLCLDNWIMSESAVTF